MLLHIISALIFIFGAVAGAVSNAESVMAGQHDWINMVFVMLMCFMAGASVSIACLAAVRKQELRGLTE